MKLKVCHIISGLNVGGAEIMLRNLVERQRAAGTDAEVISLGDYGPLADSISALDVPVHALGIRPKAPNPIKVVQLIAWLRRIGPDVVHTWMYHSDLLGGIAAKAAGKVPVLWHIHHSNLVHGKDKNTTLLIARICARLSRVLPSRVACCSQASVRIHSDIGYAPEKLTFLPNGIDVSRYRPDRAVASEVREELGVPAHMPLIGLIGRFHPQKDHRTFIDAAALLVRKTQSARFVLCGDGITWQNAELTAWIDDAGLREKFLLLGTRSDIPRLLQCLQIATLSSAFGEAFSLTLLEAMACGVPCVVTNVGDSAYIVGDAGIVVPPGDAAALAGGWARILEMSDCRRQALGLDGRRRVVENFDLDRITVRFDKLYQNIVSEKAAAN